MNKSTLPEYLVKRFAEDGIELEPIGLSDRDYATALLPELDYEAQLLAIESLLGRNAHADEKLAETMGVLKEHLLQLTGGRRARAIEDWGSLFYASIYQDAAHSMAAAGMLAPFIESMFKQTFSTMRGYWIENTLPLPDHLRWSNCEPSSKKRWNCSLYWDENEKCNTGIVEGINQLAESVGLDSYLPAEMNEMLSALFVYRNKMFHNGFEWPPQIRNEFKKRMEDWPASWFSAATRGEDVWIYYMTNDFISEFTSLIAAIIEGIGRFARDMHGKGLFR